MRSSVTREPHWMQQSASVEIFASSMRPSLKVSGSAVSLASTVFSVSHGKGSESENLLDIRSRLPCLCHTLIVTASVGSVCGRSASRRIVAQGGGLSCLHLLETQLKMVRLSLLQMNGLRDASDWQSKSPGLTGAMTKP